MQILLIGGLSDSPAEPAARAIRARQWGNIRHGRSLVGARGRDHRSFESTSALNTRFSTLRAAQYPHMPCTPPPGGVLDELKNTFAMPVVYGSALTRGRVPCRHIELAPRSLHESYDRACDIFRLLNGLHSEGRLAQDVGSGLEVLRVDGIGQQRTHVNVTLLSQFGSQRIRQASDGVLADRVRRNEGLAHLTHERADVDQNASLLLTKYRQHRPGAQHGSEQVRFDHASM